MNNEKKSGTAKVMAVILGIVLICIVIMICVVISRGAVPSLNSPAASSDASGNAVTTDHTEDVFPSGEGKEI